MATVIDARGLSCPQPVILVRKAIQAGQLPLEVMVDTVTARDNVTRMAEKAGCKVQWAETGGEFKLTIVR